jgi:hypothetical protein
MLRNTNIAFIKITRAFDTLWATESFSRRWRDFLIEKVIPYEDGLNIAQAA